MTARCYVATCENPATCTRETYAGCVPLCEHHAEEPADEDMEVCLTCGGSKCVGYSCDDCDFHEGYLDY